MAAERVDEGRWESEGGGAIHRPLGTEKSPDTPIASLAKVDTPPSSSQSTTTTPIKPSDYNVSSVHPSVIEGAEPGKAEDSRYPSSASKTEGGKEGGESASEEKPQAVQRKKSISERLTETWQDIKHKAGQSTQPHQAASLQ